MKHARNNQSDTLRPLAAGHVKAIIEHGDDDRSKRRGAVRQAGTRRDLMIGGAVLSIFAAVAGASFSAGGGRPLARDIDHAAHAALRNRTEAVGDAFSGPTPVVTGEPSNAVAAKTVQETEAHNAALEAAKAAEATQGSDELPH